MKNLILALSFSTLTLLSFCQTDNTERKMSNLEAFSNRQGTFLLEESNSLGYFSDVSGRLDMTWALYTDLKNNEKFGGLKWTVYSDNPVIKALFEGGILVKTTFYIDLDEIETLASFIAYFDENLYKTAPKDATSLVFTSTEKTRYSFYYSQTSYKWVFKISPYPYYKDSSFTYILKKETIGNLLNVLKQAKEIIIEKTK